MPTTASNVTREHVETFLGDLTDRASAATVAKHYRSLQQLFRWLVEDGEIPRSPMERMRPLAVPEQPVPVFTDDELGRLLAAAKGNTFENRRDTAILRLLIDTGVRAGEITGLTVADVDFAHDVAYVMGKGRRGRAVPVGQQDRRLPAPLPAGPGQAPAGRPAAVVARPEGAAHRLRPAADPRATRRRGGRRQCPPAPVSAQFRPRMARRRKPGAGPHAPRRIGAPGRWSAAMRRLRPTNVPATPSDGQP